MTIPSQISQVIAALDRELNLIELNANKGLDRLRNLLMIFPDNLVLIKLLSTLNNSLLFGDNTRRRIQITIDNISNPLVSEDLITQAGEDLGELLGRVIETKILVIQAVETIENLL